MTAVSSKENNIDPSQKSYTEIMYNANADFLTVWFGTSSMPAWFRLWLVFLLLAVITPFAFLPHPFAIANVLALVVIMGLNGRELVRVRGINKNMGRPHVVAWIPVVVVDILSISTEMIVVSSSLGAMPETITTAKPKHFLCGSTW